MTEQHLKPCPFCGSIPRYALDKVRHCSLHGDPSQAVNFHCSNSACQVKPDVSAGDIYNGGLDKAKSEARAAWNTRAPVAVKPLEWLEDEFGRLNAVTPLCDYCIDGGPSICYTWENTHMGQRVPSVLYKAPEQAKDAAQADYAAHVLAALTPDAAPQAQEGE